MEQGEDEGDNSERAFREGLSLEVMFEQRHPNEGREGAMQRSGEEHARQNEKTSGIASGLNRKQRLQRNL